MVRVLTARSVGVASVALVVLAACAGAIAAPARHANAAPNLLRVTIGAHGYRIVGHPRPGRITIAVSNASDAAAEFSFQPLKRNVTVAEVAKALKTKGEGAVNKLLAGDSDALGFGEPAIVGAHSSVEIVTAPVVRAGDYVAASFLPGADGRPQALAGLLGGFTVTGAKVAAVPAHVAGTIRLTDHRIEMPRGFNGTGTYAVVDAGKRPHDLSLAALPKRVTLQTLFSCVGASFGKGKPIDACPGRLMGGVNTIRPGATAYLVLHLAPGRYGYVSTADGDFQAGLRGTVTVR